ncbi:VOC family protein [Cytobacillus kochii]|uniref:VOC family protein n=1 Tax=Cytobacillus TaxID=2675230 RepID=UPI0027866141|nr:VOC family protein [Cytobacillus kochii]MDQ0185609.1 glutathione S-transferase [Cytobacillus kochii]
MIEGLYEAHLPVKNLDDAIEFYTNLGLQVALRDEETVFLWIEKDKSWLGLWQGEEYKLPYHPSVRHVAFRVSYENLKRSLNWLETKGIEAVPFGNRKSVAPFIRSHQSNASVYFKDPDGNSLELMCTVDTPEELQKVCKKWSITEWEESLKGLKLQDIYK